MRKSLVLPGGYYVAEQGKGRYLLLKREHGASSHFVQIGEYSARYLAAAAAYKDAALKDQKHDSSSERVGA